MAATVSKKPRREQRQIKMHPRLLMDVIKRQAGTIGKSIAEGVMNSVDAGASYCNITLDGKTLVIEDDGGGFPTEEYIGKFFETFGQPPEEGEKKTYGYFRMGRGQLFAAGENVWESGDFRMNVNIQEKGSEWELEHDVETGITGCRITVKLYSPLLPSDLAAAEREVKKYVKYVSIPVRWNGTRISKDPALGKWDYTSDKCFVRLTTTGGLSVYNLGVFVKEFPGHQYGRGGEVVSREQLMLNFARNDVMVSQCPVWKEVRKFVSEAAGREISRRPAMTESERQRLADQIKTSELTGDAAFSVKVITDVCGRHWTIDKLRQVQHYIKSWTVAPLGHQLAFRLHRQKAVFAFASQTLDRFDLSRDPKGFREMLCNLIARRGNWHNTEEAERFAKWRYRSLTKLTEQSDSRYEIIDSKDWTPDEKVWLDMLSRHGGWTLAGALNKERRKVLLGIGPADVWTDGATYICVNRTWIARRSYTKPEHVVCAGLMLLHAYCHDESDQKTHTHDVEFYQNYAELAPAVGKFAEAAIRGIVGILKRYNRKPSNSVLRSEDRLHILDGKGDSELSDLEDETGPNGDETV